MADSSLASKSRRNILNPPKHQPPTAGRRTRPRSPIQQARRVGRALRSHSRETAGDEGPRDVVGASTRGVRQLSTESVGSGQGSDMKGRRRKGKGKALRSGIDIRGRSTGVVQNHRYRLSLPLLSQFIAAEAIRGPL
jgi:hypothetical protein